MTETNQDGIAIIGMTGRFPGANNVDEFWRNLVAGVESISRFSPQEMAAAGLDAESLSRDPDYVPARGIIKDPEWFDAAFFGIPPQEAGVMDPQHRLFLEAAWEALETAGYASEAQGRSIGVYAGMSNHPAFMIGLRTQPQVMRLVGDDLVSLGSDKDYLATRVAYKLDLRGPAVNVSTACSTSLVTVCLACQSLLNYQCDMALAGGVSVVFPQQRGYRFEEGSIVSPDGHCRAFDAKAQGTVFSNGLAIVVLKRLADALADGDQIHAVIKGFALNNDGANKVSFGAPSVEGQAEAIAMAQALAGFNPRTITYVEAHGTATPLGDPIEIAALTQAFQAGTSEKNFCAIGSVKTNVGHLDTAAGAAGLIKTALALKHKILPPSLHYREPNPKINFAASPFYVVNRLTEWKSETPRRAGVSSFGTGGTNAHAVLEEAPALEPSGPSRPSQLLLLSAKTVSALDVTTANVAAHLKTAPDVNLADAAFTLQTGRAAFNHRRMLVCAGVNDAVAALASCDPKRVFTQQRQLKNPPVAFMFPGQGAQYVNMGAELYRTEPLFREEIDRCAEIVRPQLGLDLREVLFPAADNTNTAEDLLVQTRITQPALFVIEYALAKLWMSWGIKPAAMIGHSVGEYVAGCLAGVFALEEALVLVARRAQLVQAQPGGAMLAVRLPEKDVLPFLNERLSIAAVNSPNLCVVSGPHDAVAALEKELEAKKIAGRRLQTSHAFHSAMMDPVLAPFTELLKKIPFKPPQIPYVSNVTARWITAAEAMTPAYWAGHVRQAVRFADGVGELLKEPHTLLLEVGPGQTLSQLARQHPAKAANQMVLSSFTAGKDQPLEIHSMLTTLGRLWLAGVDPDWSGFYRNERRHRIPLPTYPFERKRFWIEPAKTKTDDAASAPVMWPSGTPPATPDAQTESAPAPATPSAALPRKERIVAMLVAQLRELSGMAEADINPAVNFMDLGLDSLFLTQASQAFKSRFGVKITFRQLMEELTTLNDVAAYLDEKLPPEALPTPPAAGASPGPVAATAPTSLLDQVQQQLQALTRQLESLRTGGAAPVVPAPALPAAPAVEKAPPKGHGPFKPIDQGRKGGLTAYQQAHLDDLIARYTKHTAESKRLTQMNRLHLADPRTVAGFKLLWKEMVYPIVCNRSSGAKVWDVDGNEYVDFIMGFGANLFGHLPPFVIAAAEEQLRRGVEIGPQTPLAGQAAQLICELTGVERAAFCNTGSEAVMAALRVARTVTGRDKVLMFSGDYHGVFDEVLVRPGGAKGDWRTVPIAPGIPQNLVENMATLEYGSAQSLEILRARAHELAAVIVEPVQGRRLDLQPGEFLRELRAITEKSGAALIFDEVVTGFRIHPGGAQAWFDVRADLVTYGKVIGGGFPIGVVAGKAQFMDALDGGSWQFGDDSSPEVGVTFFAGTFVRHPLALAVACAVLNHLKQAGPALQKGLNETTARLAAKLNSCFADASVPLHFTQFSSLMGLAWPADLKYASLLPYHLRLRGIHAWENRSYVLTTAHTEQDLERFVTALGESVAEMQAGGFLPERASGASAGGGREAVADAQSFPLTEAQKEVWLATQLGDDALRAFNETFVIRMRGPLHLDALRETLQELVDRHDALRTSFLPDGSSQRVSPFLKLPVTVSDWSGSRDEDREQQLAQAAATQDQKLFDLANGPLIRVALIKLASPREVTPDTSPGPAAPTTSRGEDHHALILTAHHLIADGWSIGVWLHELGVSYSAKVTGKPSPLEPAMQYREYVEWQQSPESQVEAAEAGSYWVKQFANPPPPVELPPDRPRPAIKTYRSATERLHLGPEFYRDLKQASARQGSTLVAFLLAGFKAWLYRLGGQEDIVVGVPTAGQLAVTGPPAKGSRALVGHCVNLLPVRSHCDANAPFSQCLATVKRAILDAVEHQHFTFGSLVEKLNLPRDPSRVPLVSVTFNVDRAASGFRMEGLRTEVSESPKAFNFFDLSINIVDTDAELFVDCHFNTDLFDPGTIRQWLNHFKTLLEGVAANPDTQVAELPLLTGAERHRLLVEWNQTRRDYPRDRCVHELFEEQAACKPDVVALELEEERLTYGQLNECANRLAHQLRAAGVAPDTLVTLCVERSMEMVVALLAILKAGGAYVPLAPDYPPDRLAFMLADTQSPVLLTQRQLASRLPAHQARVILLDAPETSSDDRRLTTNPVGNARPDNLAYVIYTSGSTGRPKGTTIPHRAVVRLVKNTDFAAISAAEVFLQFAPVSFDASTLEIWGPLLNGGRLVIMPPGTPSLEKLSRVIERHGVTTLWLTAGLFNVMVDERLGDLKRLRQLLAGGDVLSVPHVKKALAGLPGCRFINGYGPTENTTFTCCHTITAADAAGASIPIGRPIANTQVYILDQRLQPVPVGVPGELLVGGDGLARDYLNQPELTREKFIPHPFSDVPGARLYRTGDLCRHRADGTIEFLGRIDQQVKIRGFRVELEEIETVLKQHPGVREAVVVAREQSLGDKRLVAYFVAPSAGGPGTDELRNHLRTRLPDYMMPSAFVPMESLPLNPNGKVDRKALPAPEMQRLEAGTEYVAPRSEAEQALADIWQQVLRVPRVGLHDNFFELGGHSLLATQVTSRIRDSFQVEVPLGKFLEAPTVARLAVVVEENLIEQVSRLSEEEARRLAGASGDTEANP